LLFGDGGTGKTSFVTRFAPEPIAIINLDKRARHAVAYAREKLGRKVLYTEVEFPANITRLDEKRAKEIGQAAINKVYRNFDWAVEQSISGNVRSICLDTGTEYGEILRIAITGRPDRTKGDYGISKDLINREWWRIFNRAREGNAHLIVLSRAKAIWVNNEPTGQFTYRGQEVMYDAADVAAQIRIVKRRLGKALVASKEYEIEIKKAGINGAELGNIYRREQWEELGGPFVYMAMQQWEDTDMEDWQ
jgi:hypothetical protein